MSDGTYDDPPYLPPDHQCRVDDLRYASVSAWYIDHRGRVPIQAAIGLSRYVKENGCTFAEAFSALIGRGALILIKGEPGPEQRKP